MKRRIEHARARCQKSSPSQKQKTEGKHTEKQPRKEASGSRNSSR
jgi:hypothetical protein